MVPPVPSNSSDPDEVQPSASSLLTHFTPAPPLSFCQLPIVAWLLNPPPAIKFLLDCWLQHLPFVQDWPLTVAHDMAQLPQWALSVLVLVHAPLQAILPLPHTHWLLTQSGVDPPHVPHGMLVPQPSGAVPQFCPLMQASAMVFGLHAHLLLTQAGVDPLHVPHEILVPQPSGAVLQFCPLTHACAIVFGVQTHLLLTQLGVDPLHPGQV